MAVLKRRDRIVVFRLTQEEYKRLSKACNSTGARNLSDFTRQELLDMPSIRKRSDQLEGRLTKFEKKLADVQSAVRLISRQLQQLADSRE